MTIEITSADAPSVSEAGSRSLQVLNYDRREDVFAVSAANGAARLASTVVQHLIEHPGPVLVDNHTLLPPITMVVNGLAGTCAVIRIERRSERSS